MSTLLILVLLITTLLSQKFAGAVPMDQGGRGGSWNHGNWPQQQTGLSNVRPQGGYEGASSSGNFHANVFQGQSSTPDHVLDQQILDSLLEDLNHQGHSVDKNELGDPHMNAEPPSLRDLQLHSPRNDHPSNGVVTIAEESGIRNQINNEAFDGKLNWVNLKDIRGMKKDLSNRTPYKMQHRTLPSITVQPSHLGPSQVFMTTHETVPNGAASFSELHGKRYYMFWGLPGRGLRRKAATLFYGMGYLDSQHTAAVGTRATNLEMAAKEALSRSHV